MYFSLHHSTGALILSAEDRDQVVSWTVRQLGLGAKAASVLELEGSYSAHWSEQPSKGALRQEVLSEVCEARLSFMADSVQRVNGFGREVIETNEWYRTSGVTSRTCSTH